MLRKKTQLIAKQAMRPYKHTTTLARAGLGGSYRASTTSVVGGWSTNNGLWIIPLAQQPSAKGNQASSDGPVDFFFTITNNPALVASNIAGYANLHGKHFINGKNEVDSKAPSFQSYNPATREYDKTVTFHDATSNEIDTTLREAAKASESLRKVFMLDDIILDRTNGYNA